MASGSFCDGRDEGSCGSCENHDSQHPCWFRKVKIWQAHGGLHVPREPNPKSAPASVPNGSYDQAIPTDSRGMPFLGSDLDPITQKRLNDLGSSRVEARRRELAQGHIESKVLNNVDI